MQNTVGINVFFVLGEKFGYKSPFKVYVIYFLKQTFQDLGSFLFW